MAEVGFSPAARMDLELIADFIARDDPARAVTFIRELRDRTTLLADHPEAGRSRDDVRSGLRSLAHGRYVIFYSVHRSVVRIERVLHGARDVTNLLRS